MCLVTGFVALYLLLFRIPTPQTHIRGMAVSIGTPTAAAATSMYEEKEEEKLLLRDTQWFRRSFDVAQEQPSHDKYNLRSVGTEEADSTEAVNADDMATDQATMPHNTWDQAAVSDQRQRTNENEESIDSDLGLEPT